MNCPVTASYYSFVQTKDGVHLMARWHEDYETGAMCFTSLFFEPCAEGESINAAWSRLKDRVGHLATMPAARKAA